MRSFIIGLGIFYFLLVLESCYYDKEEVLYPDSFNCNSVSNPSFNVDVLPLLNAKCNNCHSGSFPSGNIRLDTFADVLKYANNGSLMGSINQTSGYSPMPKNGTKLSACQIQTIQNWITAGTVDN
ncbi:MAG TPA: hypothetical protein VFW11_18755 [Cyclobacteriaceae bacterium]|nr:hypothetical protein [Cyclobacteriaceae bacterium]